MRNHSAHTWKTALAKVLVAVMVMLSVLVVPNTVTKAASTPKLTKSSSNILEGGTIDLNVSNKVKKSTYTWTTSNKKVATVDKNGIVTGVKKGTAVITCTVKTSSKTYKLTCKVSILKPALAFRISNKIKALNVGQTYDVNRVLAPSTSNDKTTWTSSDKSIAAPDKYGKFTALKEGTVTITGTTLSGKKDSMTFTVVDKEGTVETQAELKALLGSGVGLITIKTDEEEDFTIKGGKYTGTKLVVDAPKADVHNSGVFASIDIKQIAANSWYENAVGNLLNVLASNSRIVVGPSAKVNIEVTAEGAKLTIENNGVIEKVVVEKPADINIAGDSKHDVPVVVNAANIKITSSVPLNLECNKKISLVLLPGAEATKVTAASKDVIPAISGNVKIEVKVGKGDSATTETVTGTPITDSSSPAGGNPGGNNGGNITPTPTPTTPAPSTITFDTAISNIESVSLTSSNNNKTEIDSLLLAFVKGLLTSDTAASTWSQIVNTEYTVSGQTISIKGVASNYTKTVTVKGGQFDGKIYTITVNNTGTSVTITNSNSISVTLTKSADDKAFSLTTSYTLQNAENSQTLSDICDVLNTVTVKYNGKTYTVDWPELVTIKKYFDNKDLESIAWLAFTNETKVIDGDTIKITGTFGDPKKTVTFVSGQFAGKVYTVTLNTSKVIITNSSNVTATIENTTNNISVTLN